MGVECYEIGEEESVHFGVSCSASKKLYEGLHALTHCLIPLIQSTRSSASEDH